MTTIKIKDDGACECKGCKADRSYKLQRESMTNGQVVAAFLDIIFAAMAIIGVVLVVIADT